VTNCFVFCCFTQRCYRQQKYSVVRYHSKCSKNESVQLFNWLKKSRHFVIQSELKPKSIATRSRTFSRTSHQLHILEFWLVLWFACVLCDWPGLLLVLVLLYSTENRLKLFTMFNLIWLLLNSYIPFIVKFCVPSSLFRTSQEHNMFNSKVVVLSS